MANKQRTDVMLSSTFRDLKTHRDEILDALNERKLTPLAQEFDDALADVDLIKASLDKVDAADVYVGVIGSRYGQAPLCPIRNPKQLSLTELEYRRAVERDLPRCMFIMATDHPLTQADVDLATAEGEANRDKRTAFIARVHADRIAANFSSIADLRVKVTNSLIRLIEIIEASRGAQAATRAPIPWHPDDDLPSAPPSFHFVRRPYATRRNFVGREHELAFMDSWALTAEPILLFQAIGGMGKSMLTWRWAREDVLRVRDDWAGRLWYSFYEQGADMNDFCVHALAYITKQPPREFRKRRTPELGAQLLRELNRTSWLLMLDGLERVLVAYHRSDAAHVSDDDATVATDGLGLDRKSVDCFRREDGELLELLGQAQPSKILASSRLMPSALLNNSKQPLPGVVHVQLDGLDPADAERMMRDANVRGNGAGMRHYLQEMYGCHPLAVGAVAGLINNNQLARGDFDLWVADTRGGGDPTLIAKSLTERQSHILAQAFSDLDAEKKELLGRIAIMPEGLTLDALRMINPKRPLPPKKVEEPKDYDDEVENPFAKYL